MRLRVWLPLFAIAAASLVSRPAGAFKTKYHREITKAALAFLKDDVLDAIIRANEFVDTPPPFCKALDQCRASKDAFHFNDCGFAPASKEIRTLYGEIVNGGNPALFGRLLHTVQDFYAHSNWVEQELTGLVTDKDAFGTQGDGSFPILETMVAKGNVILLGADPHGYALMPGSTPRRVMALASSGSTFRGIVTGSYDGDDERKGRPDACPALPDIGHWDRREKGRGLNKDTPARPGFDQAYRFAYRQTVEEWCRLRHLVQQSGAAVEIDGWLKADSDSKKRAENVCVAGEVTPTPPTTDEKVFNVKVRAGAAGFVTGADVSSGDWTFVGSLDARWDFVGVTGGVGYARAFSGGWWVPWQGGLLVAWPSLLGGPVGAAKWVRSPDGNRIVLDLGWDVFPWRPTKPIAPGGPVRISALVGWADPFGRRAFGAGMGLSWSPLNFDYPW